MPPSKNSRREVALAIAPKFTAFLSVLGSGYIVYDILCSHFNVSKTWWKEDKDNPASSDGFSRRTASMQTARARSSRRFGQRKTLKNSAYYRLMLAMSCSDFIVSFAWFMTTWPIPTDENSIGDPGVYGNSGNTQTCTAQAFFIQLGIVTPFYNALLACYYYLTIRREWKEEEFKCRIEYAGHFLSISFGFGTAVAGLVMKLFNNSKVWCWIAPYPSGCGDGPKQQPCVRGVNAAGMRWAFYYGPLWVMIFLVGMFMTLVYLYVRGLDNKMDQYTASYRTNAARPEDSASGEMSAPVTGGRPGRRRSLMARTFSTMNADTITEQRRQRRNERSKAVANQGLFYAGTFALVWLAGTIVRALQLAGQSPPWLLILMFAVFTPSQGFFNFLVYVRPRLIKFFETRKKERKNKKNSNSRGGSSSFSSDILHVSGISGVSSSNEVSGENQNRDASTRSDIDLSEPFTNMKVRFAASGVDDEKESQFPTKVRFVNDDEKSDDSEPLKSDGRIPTVKLTLSKDDNEGSTEEEISDVFYLDDKSVDSDETIDPDLLSPTLSEEELEKVELRSAKENGDELVELHNATIDLATGEVRTRMAVRRVKPR